MMEIREAANWLADLSFAPRLLILLVLLILTFAVVYYLLGARNESIERVFDAELPKTKDPRQWLKKIRAQGRLISFVVAGFFVVFFSAMFLLLFFPDVPIVRTVLERDQYDTQAPHLYVQMSQNYSYLYLAPEAQKEVSAIEDSLEFQNVSKDTLTFFRITAWLYKDFGDMDTFYNTYSLDHTNYISLGVVDVGTLAPQESFKLQLADIYEKIQKKFEGTNLNLHNLLLPTIGQEANCRIAGGPTTASEKYTNDAELLGKVSRFVPQVSGKPLDAICGTPLKLVLTYRIDSNIYSLLFLGGTYYFGRRTDAGLIPFPAAIASFVKPRLSLMREQSGAEDNVINMDLEIAGRYSGQLRDGLLSVYTVTQPESEEQLDQQLAINLNTTITRELADKASKEIENGRLREALATVERLINLEPTNQKALEVRAWILDRISADVTP